jgi:predicted transcriptional regulator of viral defense system
VKKGLYVFGPQAKRGLYSREVLANLIYGPSYISLEYALAFYGLIPEKVNLLTCITGKRNKYFKTPVGEFQYTYLHPSLYPWGVTWIMLDEKHHMLMATKEKAIIDKVYFTNGLTTIRDVKDFLIENLRIERDELKRLDSNTLDSIAVKYSKKAVRILPEIIRKL